MVNNNNNSNDKNSNKDDNGSNKKADNHVFYIIADCKLKLNDTVVSRMFLVNLHFSIMETGCLYDEINLYSLWEARGRGRKEDNNNNNNNNNRTSHTLKHAIKLVSKTCHQSLGHSIGANRILTKLNYQWLLSNVFDRKLTEFGLKTYF